VEKIFIGNIKTGTIPNQKLEPFTNDNTQIPFLRNSNIQEGEIVEYNFKYIKNDLEQHLTFSYKNKIIICIAGTIGITTINQNVSSLSIHKDIIDIIF
jgi:hypothetical protein